MSNQHRSTSTGDEQSSSALQGTLPKAELLDRCAFPNQEGPQRPSPFRELTPVMKSRLRIVIQHFGTKKGEGLSAEEIAEIEGHGYSGRVMKTFASLRLAGLLKFRYDPSNVPMSRREHIPTQYAVERLYLARRLEPKD